MFVQPSHTEYDVNGRKIGGLLYRISEQAGPIPAVILVGDRVDRPSTSAFSVMAQALAATGLAVLAPTLPGSTGYGKKIANGLTDAPPEAEMNDLAGLIDELRKIEGIDKNRIAIVGQGHGGALALLLAGARLGSVQAVAAIDPIADWNTEFDHADGSRRAWLVRNFGLPAVSFGPYAERTPVTFAGLIDVPLLLIGTDPAPAGRADQLELLAADLRELNVTFEQELATGGTPWTVGQRVAGFLRETLIAVVPPADPRVDHALAADAV
jgi:dipeptidyl aminopeptidase/acylaminoacyl peptidase